jgi:Immunoglobulin-like domain of bacterial spore germination
MNYKPLIGVVLALAVLGGGAWLVHVSTKSYANISSYDECVAAGYPVMETSPAQCSTPDGRTFTQEVSSVATSTNPFSDSIHVTAPIANAVVGSPLTITGEAHGTWYFEASFPIKLVDSTGKVLAQGHADAQGDWMTEDFVPFKATLTFTTPGSGTGMVVINNDNPSGDPAKDKQVTVPVQFAGTTGGGATTTGTFNKSLTLRVGDKINFSDGFSVTLKEINDSRCAPNVVCIWEGELSTLFSASSGGSSVDVRLGTVTTKSSTIKGHTIALQSATTGTATIIVTVAPTVPAASGVSGYIHTGPTCPVEQNPPNPNCADKPFAGAKVVIKSKANGSIVSQSTSDKSGNFRVTLATGTYSIDVSSASGGPLPKCETKEATVASGKFTTVDVSCDSGIR